MNRRQQHLKLACEKLNLKIELNPKVMVDSCKEAIADIAISSSDQKFRMYVFGNSPSLEILEAISKRGDGYTSYDEPTEDEKFDLKDYKEMFLEWGLIS